MHTLRNRILFFGPTAVLGGASMLLHRYMMETCFDAKGLLTAGNLPGKLLWVLGVGFAAYLLVLLRTIGGNGSFEDNFPKCLLSGGLALAGGAVMGMAVPELGFAEPWKMALCYAAAVCMAAGGLCRMVGKRPAFVIHGVVCLFYILVLVSHYQLWSADPQIQDYAYQLLAGVLLMLASFHRTCCDAGIIERRKLLFTGLCAAFCCLAALSGGFRNSFYLASGLWAAGSMCNVAVLPPDPEETPEEQPQEQAEEPSEEA